MRRLKMRDSRRDNSTAAPITSLPSTADEWLPTQVFKRSAVGQFPQAHAPALASSAGSSTLTDYGTKALGYNILSHLARGGVADVFLAERAADGTAVVLKIIDRANCDDPSALKRFIQEYTLASRIRSPHVVQVFDRGFIPDYAFISMEYFVGGDLTRKIRAGIDPATVISYMKQIAQGLFEIHKQGIVHRDMKPGNVLFRADGTAVITDFGIAKLIGSSATLTLNNSVVGTPYYTAPELIAGHYCDVASDLYSLGVVFFEMLTGEKPYIRNNIQEILSATESAPVPTLPAALAEFQPVLDRLMAKKPSDRFASAEHLLDALSTSRGLQEAQRAGSKH
jgi:serine/threonine protein kinase